MDRILIVEDEAEIVQGLKTILQQEGFTADSAAGQSEALALLEERPYGLVLTDISLSDGNGYAVCAAAKQHYQTAVIFLTASGDEFSTVAGFEMGADDYIAKPFRPRELISRIKNVLRHTRQPVMLKYRELSADTLRGKITRSGEEIILSALEYRLLLILMRHQGEVMTRDGLLTELWDAAGEYVNDNTLTVYIKRLREKIEEDPSDPQYIRTIRGIGYQFGE